MPKKVFLTAGTLLVVAGVVVVVALSLGSGGGTTAAAAGDAAPSFAVLDATSSAPHLSEAEQHALDTLAALHPAYRVDTGAARLAMAADGMRILAVPADTRVCLVVLSTIDDRTFAPSTCKLTALANQEGVLLRLGEHAPFTVAGLVPDGVARVTLHEGDGSAQSLDVTGNAYLATSHQESASLSFSSASTGTVTQSLGLE